jgi:hypothetical protein
MKLTKNASGLVTSQPPNRERVARNETKLSSAESHGREDDRH